MPAGDSIIKNRDLTPCDRTLRPLLVFSSVAGDNRERVMRRLLFLLLTATAILFFAVQASHALTPLVVYTEETAANDDIVRYQTFSSSWSGENTAVDTNLSGAQQQHVAKSGPFGDKQVVLFMDSSGSTVRATIFDGTNWDDGTGSPYGDSKALSSSGIYRAYDAAFEQTSGQLLIVGAGDSYNTIKYWVWNGTSWVVDGSSYTITNFSNNIYGIKLASKPNSNQVSLIAVDQNGDVVGLIWNGDTNAWGNEKKLNSFASSSYDAIAVEYMQTGTNGGKSLFVWGEDVALYGWVWTGSAWDSSGVGGSSWSSNPIYWVDIAADPNSDDILIGFMDTAKYIRTLSWDGTALGSTPRGIDTGYGNVSYNQPFDLIFESASGHSGHALIVYSDTTTLRYKTTTSIANDWAAEATVVASSPCYWIDLARTGDGSTIHLAAHKNVGTSGDTLLAYTWNNSSWTSQGTLEAVLLVNDTTRQYKPFALTVPPPPANITQAHYRWRNDDGYEEGGSATVAVDAISTYSTTGTNKVNPATVSHTVSGSNRLLLVGVTLWPSALGDSVTSVTWNGTGLSKITHAAAGTAIRTELWVMLAPATGTYNIVVNFTRTVPCTVGVVSFTGVNQSDPYRAASTGTGTSTSASITVASATGELVLSVAGAGTANYNFTSFSGDTERWNLSSATYPKGAGGTTAGAASVTATHGIANNNSWAIIGLPIKPASLTAATWAANEDTQLSGLTKNATRRLRFLVSNSGGASSAATYKLQSAQAATCSSGSYADVPTDTSGAWKIAATDYYTDGDASANVSSGLTDPASKTFVAGQLKDTGNTTGSITLTSSQFTEIEYAIQATDNAVLGANYCFRLWDTTGNKAMDTYTVYAQATLESMSLTQNHFRWRNDDGSDSAGSFTPSVVSASSGYINNDNWVLSFSHTVSGSNRLLLVGVSYRPTFIATRVTWNGTNMQGVQVSSGTNVRTEIYKLVAPEAGTYNIEIQFGGYVFAAAGAVTLTNVDQTTPLGTSNGSLGTSSTPSVNVASNAGDLVFGVIDAYNFDETSRNADTLHWNTESWYAYSEGVSKAGSAGSTSLTWTLGGSGEWATAGVAVKGTSFGIATFATNEDVKIGVSKGTPIRLRMMVSNGAASSTGQVQYQLQVAETGTCSSGSYTAVGSDTDWQMVNSAYFTDGAATTNVASGLTDPPSYSFTAGQLKDTSDTTGGINLYASNFTELEFSVQATDSATSLGNYCFRLYNATSGAVLNTYTNYATAKINGPTAISLLSFSATGAGDGVRVGWTTAQESENKGFNLYRAQSLGGPYVQMNPKMIPSQSLGGEGRSYEFIDTAVCRGAIYYYKLEDVDVSGTHTVHGPVCVDWEGDGIPDDWEIAYGLNPVVNDAGLDSDGDGVANRLEYARGTHPLLRDSDGDGIPDGAERKNPGYSGGAGSGLEADGAVQVLASDSRGMTLELVTASFDVTPVAVGGQSFERLRVPGYVHGFTLEPGLPQVPLKGILLDVPAGKQARLTVLDVASRTLTGFRVYPAPVHELGANNQLLEVFRWDEAAYRSSAWYPGPEAELSTEYVYRGQTKQRLIFYPLRFNPGTGELLHSERIRVRVEFVEPASVQSSGGRLRAAAAAVHPAPAAAGGWSIPAGAAYKVSTAGEGIYRITRDWLTAQGIGPTEIDAIDLSGVQLFNLGTEQAIHVYDANGNHRLDAADYISFYAAAVPAAYAKYAKHNVHWLIDAGSASPLRMGLVDGAPAGGPLAASHTCTLHHELDQAYLQSATGPDGMERWIFAQVALGAGFTGGGTAQDFSLSLPGALSTGNITVRMYSPYAMAHETTVSLNGSSIGSATWSGITWTEASFAGVSLLEGANTVSLLCTGAEDKTAVDWFEVVYERAFEAVADSLKFTHAGGYRYQVAGFTADEVELYDITHPAAVQRVVNGTYTGSGPYTLEAEPAGASGTRSYLAVGAAALKSPVAVVQDRASSLYSSANAADWVLITHRDLGWDGAGAPQGWVDRLVSLRQSQGLRTKVVDVEEIFDEFGYGLVSPQAVKEFLTHAYESWQRPAPQYVLLMGDTSYDYKDNWESGTVNHVPGYLIYTTHLGETIADEWYAQVSGNDAVADLYIGRLPAATLAQAEAMVNKIVAYESAANTKGWEKRLVLAADNSTEEWEAVFETMNEEAAALLPAAMATPERFYLQEYENESLAVTDLTAELLAAIEAGALVVNYAGHGSVNIWAAERILDNRGVPYRADVSTLANSGRYPFVVNLSCLTGYFIYPHTGGYAAASWRSLAEGFLWPADAGAVAALMPTAMTDTAGQQLLSNALYEGIFGLDQRRLGPAVGHARQQLLANGGAEYEQTSNTFMFFGDPATTLKVPLPRRPQGLTALRQADGAVALAWAAALDCDGSAVAGYNLYRRSAAEQSYTRLNTALVTALTHTDLQAAGLTEGQTYYYAIAAVDAAGDESVKSAPAALTLTSGGGGGGEIVTDGGAGGGGGGGCFIAAAGMQLSPELLMPLAAMALLVCLVWLSRRRRG